MTELSSAELSDAHLSLARDFIMSSSSLGKLRSDGDLASGALLLGQAAELLAKQRLLRLGAVDDPMKLTRHPYGHDLKKLWVTHTSLYVEASSIAKDKKRHRTIEENFFFPAHFQRLCWLHGSESHFAIRYRGDHRLFPSPGDVAEVFAALWRRERAI